MSRPQIIVTITEAISRRGTPTPTGTAFITYAADDGPDVPVVCKSQADATAAEVPDATAVLVGDALRLGASLVVVVRTDAVDNATVTQPEWAAALAKFSSDFGAGQVLIPGVSTPAAYGALLAHSAATGRTALLDTIAVPVVATVATAAAGLAASDGASKATIVTPSVTVPVSGGTTRDIPGSVIAAGLAARGDAAVGHANNAPAFDQGRGAGVVQGALGTTKTFTNAELDTLHDAGVSVINGHRSLTETIVALEGWVSLSDEATFAQLNTGRMVMQMSDAIASGMYQFQGRQIDGDGTLYADVEGWLRGYLQPLWEKKALYGDTAAEAFDVDVAGVNDDQTAAAGELRANVRASLTQHVEDINVDVEISVSIPLAA